MKNRKEIVLSIILLALFVVLILGLFVDLYPLLKQVIKDSGNEGKVVSYIHTYGIKGVLSLIGLQALQAILVVVPSAVVEILAGLCYGIWWGTLISLFGYVLGNTIIFLGVRQFKKTFGMFFASRLKESKKKNKFFDFNKIKEMEKPELLVFASYVIPGVPNGILPYMFAQTEITLSRYLISMSLASLPSTIMWTWLGDSVLKKNYAIMGIIAVVVLLILVISLIFKRQIQEKMNQLSKKGKVVESV
ncbi:VTT domain-containing protein [uncultured Vagococcus sp.]|uniref:TVP38/TMEM64 family protein n=1 Tax=uncultured Vagococcus sp. TaxID=189676 RepID=UPI0028D74355|nr:VTT domain-containing protein [uncultured Vagococcus sp.]